jgi:membrane protein implicated in regulation of membrane protease activity
LVVKFLLLLLPVGVTTLFATDVAQVPYSTWVQGGAAAVVCGLLVFIVVRLIPQMLKEHREALEKQREEFTATLNAMGERFERLEAARDQRDEYLASELKGLAINCEKHRQSA